MPGIQTLTDTDNTQNTSPTGGSTGGPAIVNTKTITIGWSFPSQFNSLILGFEVVAYTGTDITDNSKWLFKSVCTDPTVRQLVKTIAPSVSMPVVNAGVRAIYA